MKIECPKCGLICNQTEEELTKLNHIITCPKCMSSLKIVNGVAYIPTDKAPIEELKPFEEQPPKFKGTEYYQTHANLGNLDPLYSSAVEYIKTCNMITLPMLQRYFDITPERAELLMQQLEDNKVVSPFDGVHPRKILINHNTNINYVTSHQRRFNNEAQYISPEQTDTAANKNNIPEPPRSRKWLRFLPTLGVIIFILLLCKLIASYFAK